MLFVLDSDADALGQIVITITWPRARARGEGYSESLGGPAR